MIPKARRRRASRRGKDEQDLTLKGRVRCAWAGAKAVGPKRPRFASWKRRAGLDAKGPRALRVGRR